MELKTGDIILVKDTSIISKLIRWFTNSQFSHCGIWLDNKHIFHTEYNLGAKITHNTYEKEKLEIYRVTGVYDENMLYEFLDNSNGKKYDLVEILKIIFNINKQENDSEYICSSLIYEAYKYAGLDLFNGNMNKIPTPQDISKSEYLVRIK